MFVLMINGGQWCAKKSKQEIKDVFVEEGVNGIVFEDEEVLDLDEGIERLLGGMEKVYNDEWFEMGDDYCELEIMEVNAD